MSVDEYVYSRCKSKHACILAMLLHGAASKESLAACCRIVILSSSGKQRILVCLCNMSVYVKRIYDVTDIMHVHMQSVFPSHVSDSKIEASMTPRGNQSAEQMTSHQPTSTIRY